MAIFSHSPTVLWVGTFFYGLSMSSAFPTAIHLAERYMKLTGTLTSIMVVGASFGEMAIPLFVAKMFAWSGPTSFLYILLFCSVAGLAVYGGTVITGGMTAKGKKGYSGEEVEDGEMGETISFAEERGVVVMESYGATDTTDNFVSHKN